MSHRGEDRTDRMETGDAFPQASPTRVPHSHDRCLNLHGTAVGDEDRLAAIDSHRTALVRDVGCECDYAGAVDVALRREHSAGVLGGEEFEVSVEQF
jgi:hypothetical protein